MEFNEKIKAELEGKIKDLEKLIAEKGIGAKQLRKARRTQRNVNLAVIVGSLITVAGITLWAVSGSSNKD
ncbi:hypothetical protein [uncultured Draconibacterium sp.]|uniref:hypothetical protein n=1 Tax=uncultured Draconibacterium sp. TaxID=1573823 RepID=UPI0029C85D96|nr:hypothetical protein [uncultured Draconibacterium sp.]